MVDNWSDIESADSDESIEESEDETSESSGEEEAASDSSQSWRDVPCLYYA